MESNLHAFVSRCETLFAQGRWDDVEGLAREVVGRGMSQPLVLAMMGIAYAKRGNLELAKQALGIACAGQGSEAVGKVAACLRAHLDGELAEAVRRSMSASFPQESAFADPWSPDLQLRTGPSGIGAWPYMNEAEVQSVLVALRTLGGPIEALEWGGGHSTYFYAQRLVTGSTWHSVEHDRSWFATIDSQARPKEGATLDLQFVPNSGPFRDGVDDGDMTSFREYIVFPRRLGTEFKFILVDGRARVECLREGWRLLARDGIMVLHDGERPEYRPGHPADAYSLEVSNPSMLERKAIVFFTNTLDSFRTLCLALREALPIFVAMSPGMPRER